MSENGSDSDASDESTNGTGQDRESGSVFVDGAYVLTNDGQVQVCLSSKLNEFEPKDAEELADAIRQKAAEARGGEP